MPAALRGIRLPPLVLQPLVENAVKHGIGRKVLGGKVIIRARLERTDGERPRLSLVVQDTGAGSSAASLQRGREAGVGLRNVERRLECQYGSDARLSIQTAQGEGTTVEILLPVDANTTGDQDVRQVAV